MNFQSHKCPDRQTDMVTLRNFEPVLTTFNTRELLDAPMADLNLPGIQGMKSSLFDGHIEAAGSPIFRVAVFAYRFNPAVILRVMYLIVPDMLLWMAVGTLPNYGQGIYKLVRVLRKPI